jgi:hypothetical protein
VERIDLEAVPVASIAPVTREGRKVLGAGRVLLVSQTAEGAQVEAERLAALAAGTPVQPAEPGAELEAVRALRRRQRPWILALRVTGGALGLSAGVAWPAVAYGPPEAAAFGAPLLATLAALIVTSAALVLGMLRACGEPTGKAAAAAAHLITYPMASLHPLWGASRALYRRFDPLTVAAALLPPDRFALLAARELRRAACSRAATPPELAPAWDARVRRLEALLAAAGIPLTTALAPPRRHADCAGWCPLCRAQLRPGFDTCGDCGVPVEPFERHTDEGVSPA